MDLHQARGPTGPGCLAHCRKRKKIGAMTYDSTASAPTAVTLGVFAGASKDTAHIIQHGAGVRGRSTCSTTGDMYFSLAQ